MDKINTAAIKRKTLAAFRPVANHHALIFIVGSLLLLMFVVYNTQRILTIPEDSTYRAEVEKRDTKTTFDQETIKKVEQLQYRRDALKPELPTSGRINPFAE